MDSQDLPQPEPTLGNTAWWTHDRFGLFIHWGIYALAARHEWVKKYEQISDTDYQPYFDHFDPDLYDPAAWARSAREAGMRYVVLTSKHHDGFCLWDSRLTDYKATNTPANRDLLQPFVEAFRAEGLKVGLYYSLIDWHHPEFPVDGVHPQANDLAFREATKDRDVRKYAKYLHGQVREILTNFGTIDLLWLDFSYSQQDYGWSKGKGKDDWQSEELIRMVRELQPDIIINNRSELGAGLSTRPSNSSRPVGCTWTASPSIGKPARPSTAPGATTVTIWTGSRPNCSCRCSSIASPKAAIC